MNGMAEATSTVQYKARNDASMVPIWLAPDIDTEIAVRIKEF
jgi:hypothetical protein